MLKKNLLFLSFFVLVQLKAHAGFVFDANCTNAYNAILSLKLAEAKKLIQKEKQQNPGNGITILLENYVDYFALLASESKDDYERMKDNKSARISALEDNDSNSPYYLFSQAEVYIQWSFLKVKFGDYVSSGWDAKKANGLLKDNAEKYPDFLPNQKSLALVNVIFGSIPASFRGITRFLGMNGDAQAGIKQLEQLRVEFPKSKYSFYNNEVVFFLSTINIDVLHNYSAYSRVISYLSTMDSNSLLRSFLEGYISVKAAHNDEAINYLETRPKSSEYVNVPVINYWLGVAKLNRMDNDTPIFFLDFVKDTKGINYLKDAYLKLAYYYLLQNNNEKYNYYVKMAKTKGYTTDEKDKQALKEANDIRPDVTLLRARFYFDGGYYPKALAELTAKDVTTLKLLRDKTEYYYRLGRIYEKTDKPNDAILNYQRTINFGKTTSYYYAANAALSIGLIYEQKKDYNKAADFYNQALDMKNHEYQNSIDNDAKAGLKRIGH
jgi:tetratricopeptide (TPR) repeat protein